MEGQAVDGFGGGLVGAGWSFKWLLHVVFRSWRREYLERKDGLYMRSFYAAFSILDANPTCLSGLCCHVGEEPTLKWPMQVDRDGVAAINTPDFAPSKSV